MMYQTCVVPFVMMLCACVALRFHTHFQNTVSNGSESMSSSILAGTRPARQQISSTLCCPVYSFCRPTGVTEQIGYLLMHRIRRCCSPNVTSFLAKRK